MHPDGSFPVRLTDGVNPEWSAEGAKIVYQHGGIRVMDADGSNQLQLSTSGFSPTFSPGGDKIAFNDGRSGRPQIWVMDADGSNPHNISNTSATNDYQPTWSPDGQTIAFQRESPFSFASDIYAMNADGTNQHAVYTAGSRDSDPDFSPDGTRLVFNSDNTITIVGVDGSGAVSLTGGFDEPRWSPDGTKVLFSRFTSSGEQEIFVINADGSGETNLTNHPARDRKASWQPGPGATCPPDTTPPVVTGIPDRLANAAGWYRAPVTIDWVATDPEPASLPVTDPPDTIASTEGQDVVYTSDPACDAAGNCATGSLALSIDLTPPTVSPPVFSVNPKTVSETTTVTAGARDSSAVFLIFVSERDGKRVIYRVAPDGSSSLALTQELLGAQAQEWSPDGTKIAFEGDSGLLPYHHGTEVILMKHDGTSKTVLTDFGTQFEGRWNARRPRWSPDGSKLAFQLDFGSGLVTSDIYVVRPDGAGLTNLTNAPTEMDNGTPAWSPDGQRIAFLSNRHNPPPYGGPFAIHLMNPDGSGVVRLTPSDVHAQSISWAPDGGRIVFAGTTQSGQGSNHVFVIDASGSGLVDLGVGLAPSWSPDGGHIVYECFTTDWGICTVRPDGAGLYVVANDAAIYERNPVWSPDSRSIAFEAHVGDQTYVETVQEDGTARTRLTSTGRDLIAFGSGTLDSSQVWRPVAAEVSCLAGGEFFVGTDPGLGRGTAMTALDGAFDSCAETLTGTIGTDLSPGVYTVGVRSRDAADNWSTTESALLVVYDPDGGFVTGGGWIDSPAGAYRADPTLTGRANFGFVSKYEPGATVPTGQTELQFQVARFNFHSEWYQWLVVSGAKAQYKGTGTVNGLAGYSFLLTATDGQVTGGGGTDKFRIKIWVTETEELVYDTAYGSSDDLDEANPQPIAGGSIVIHTK